jgi:hypothetical protein
MCPDNEQIGRTERIKLLATQNRRRRERTFLSAEISKITGQAFTGDEFHVAVGVGEIDHSFANIGDGEELECSLPEGYLERNKHLFGQFGGMIPEREVILYLRLMDVWSFSLSSEIAFSHVLEFANLERSFSRYSGNSFRVAAPDSKCGLDLGLHRYYHITNNRWECYKKTWELSVLGKGWCEVAERIFVLESEA